MTGLSRSHGGATLVASTCHLLLTLPWQRTDRPFVHMPDNIGGGCQGGTPLPPEGSFWCQRNTIRTLQFQGFKVVGFYPHMDTSPLLAPTIRRGSPKLPYPLLGPAGAHGAIVVVLDC